MDVISLSSGNKLAGRYRVLQKLGEGSFAETFLSEDEHLPNAFQCVIKKLKTAVDDEARLAIAKRLFDEEARTLHQLGSHPNIPQLLAHFEENNGFYLVEEYIAGTSLYQELAAGQQWSESYVTKLLKDILFALSFVHQKQVIHRDIKPSNIIRRESDGQIVLIDFGAVKQVANQTLDENSHIAPHTVIVGTPGYMPGEQLRGSPRMSSDVYATGMIGIYALTGLNPALGQLPEDESTAEILWQDRASVSPELASIIDKMVAYDFRQRYPSAKEALEALNALSMYRQDNSPTMLNQSTVTATPPMGSGVTTNGNGDSLNNASGWSSIANPEASQGASSSGSSGITINTGGGGSSVGVPNGSVGSATLEPTSVSPLHADAARVDSEIRVGNGVPNASHPSLETTSIGSSGGTSNGSLEQTSMGTYVVSNARPAEISKPISNPDVKVRKGSSLKVIGFGGVAIVGLGAIAAFASPNIEPICTALNNCSANVKFGSVYKKASNSAETALGVINSAKSLTDLKGAQTQLQQSVQQLGTVPKAVDRYSDAQKLLPNYQKQLKNLQEKITLETKAQQDLQQAGAIANTVLTQKKLPDSLAALTDNKAKLQQATQRLDKIPNTSLSAPQRQTQKQAYLKKSKELDAEIQKQAAAEDAFQRQRQREAAAAPAYSGAGSGSGSQPNGSGSSGGTEPQGDGGSYNTAPPPANNWNSEPSSVARDPAPAPAPRETPLWGGGGGSQQAAPPPSNGGGGAEPLW
jgi:serine/threonine protein kinase